MDQQPLSFINGSSAIPIAIKGSIDDICESVVLPEEVRRNQSIGRSQMPTHCLMGDHHIIGSVSGCIKP